MGIPGFLFTGDAAALGRCLREQGVPLPEPPRNNTRPPPKQGAGGFVHWGKGAPHSPSALSFCPADFFFFQRTKQNTAAATTTRAMTITAMWVYWSK